MLLDSMAFPDAAITTTTQPVPMQQEPEKKINPIRETTPEAIRLAKTLIRTAGFGAIAVLDPRDGRPHASRVSIATSHDGTPVTLVSRLSFHTKALLSDQRCSLLLGEPDKGDPLAHPRISLACKANFLERGSLAEDEVSARFLRRNPKAGLYAGFADFNFVRLDMERASLNGGFGQAYELEGEALLAPTSEAVVLSEGKLIEGLNGSAHHRLLGLVSRSGIKIPGRPVAIGFDSEGMDVRTGVKQQRLWFSRPVLSPEDFEKELGK